MIGALFLGGPLDGQRLMLPQALPVHFALKKLVLCAAHAEVAPLPVTIMLPYLLLGMLASGDALYMIEARNP